MNTQINLPGKIIFTLLIFVVVFMNKAQSQIVYTDLIPDAVIKASRGVFHLDLNNDGVIDYDILYSRSSVLHCGSLPTKTGYSIDIQPLNDNAVVCDTSHYPRGLSANSLIFPGSQLWDNLGSQSLIHVNYQCINFRFTFHWYTTYTGHFKSDSFLGLSFHKGAQLYYGWVRISTSPDSVVVKEFAYDSLANQPILAGYTGITPYLGTSTEINSRLCTADSVDVEYYAIGNFDPGNVFNLELSDSVGNFSNPTIIGSVNSIVSGTINGTIPIGIGEGWTYLIRVTSSSPLLIAADNGEGLIMNNKLPISTIIPSATHICYGTQVYFTIPGGISKSFQWRYNGVNIINAISQSFNINSSDAEAYSCLVSNACGSVITDTVNLTFDNPKPLLEVIGPAAVCPGRFVSLQANIDTNLSYSWYLGSISIGGALQTSYSAGVTGYYYVVEWDSISGCTSYSPLVFVNVENPLSRISADGPTIFCLGDSVLLIAHTDSSFAIQWLKNLTNIPGANASTYMAIDSGMYQVTVTNPFGNCSSNSNAIRIVNINCTVGIKDFISTESLISIVPNPFSSSATISFSLSAYEKTNIKIFDVTGRLVKTLFNGELHQGTHQLEWNATDEEGNLVGDGIYLLKIETENYSQTKKLIVTN